MADTPAVNPSADIMEQVLLTGDLAKLTPQQRVAYYKAVCESVGLNPLTKPFDYLSLNGKLILYANKTCTEQLRDVHGLSIERLEREIQGEGTDAIWVVTAYGKNAKGRTDSSIGAVPLLGLKGEARSNAMMKGETKAKRRLTLSICGLGWLDETEVDAIPDARRIAPDQPEPAAPSGKIKLVALAADPVPPTEAQPMPPVEAEIYATPIDPAAFSEDKKSITPETKALIFKRAAAVNKKHHGGTAQRLILELHPDGRQIGMLTEEEGKALAAALQKGLE